MSARTSGEAMARRCSRGKCGSSIRIARTITDFHLQAQALTALAIEAAATDPDRAERIARSVRNVGRQAEAMTALNGNTTGAERITASAEEGAHAITRSDLRTQALIVWGAITATGP
jgi:hypothetical protein